jgi:hypothetical protein
LSDFTPKAFQTGAEQIRRSKGTKLKATVEEEEKENFPFPLCSSSFLSSSLSE